MPVSLSASQLALLARASPSGVAAEDKAEAADLCTLERLGLVTEHAAEICVLTDAGRRCLHRLKVGRFDPGLPP